MEVSLKEFTTDGQQAYEKMLMSLIIQFSSVQFSRSVMSDFLQPGVGNGNEHINTK